MTRVHLGATPLPQSAHVMAEAIIGSCAASWPAGAASHVTADFVLKLLTPAAESEVVHHITAPRPALVAYMGDLMGAADVGSPDAIAAVAFKALLRTLREEGQADASVALGGLMPSQRAIVHKVATGTVVRGRLQKALGDAWQDKFMDLLDSFCQPGAADSKLKLLPPYRYTAVFGSIRDADGKLLA